MIETEEDRKLRNEYEKVSKQQDKIRKEFAHLETCGPDSLQMEFVRAQAKEICAYMYRLQFTPFKAWQSALRNVIENEDNDFLYSHYIVKNEFGIYEPDTKRIDALLLIPPAPGDFPESR